jgi:hypothetical protein
MSGEIFEPTFVKQSVVLERIEYAFPGHFRDAAIAKHTMVTAFDNGHIYRIDTRLHDSIDIVVLTGPDTDVHKIFIDPGGVHILWSTKSGAVFYWHRSWKKCRRLQSFQGVRIQSIAWNLDTDSDDDVLCTSEVSTGLSLLGSDDGRLYEFCIGSVQESEFQLSNEIRFRQVMRLFGEGSVEGLYTRHFPSEIASKYYVIAATPNRLHQFIGLISSPIQPNAEGGKPLIDTSLPTFRNLFVPYENSPYFQEIPGTLDFGALSIGRSLIHSAETSFSFAWITSKSTI